MIQRVVYGFDFINYQRHLYKINDIFKKYISIVRADLEEKEIDYELPKLKNVEETLNIRDISWAYGMSASWANFSEQASIDFVDFLVDIMKKAQKFSNKLPTVGGETHIAIITKSHGFKWISKEEYKYKDYGISKH